MFLLAVNWSQWLFLIVLFATKYLFGYLYFVGAGVKTNMVVSILVASGSGLLGVTIFMFFGSGIRLLWLKVFKPKKKFTRFNRFVIKVKNNHGLAGVALLTPVLLTVPLGTLAALMITKNKKQILLYMFIAFIFWSTLFFGLYYWLNIDVPSLIKKIN